MIELCPSRAVAIIYIANKEHAAKERGTEETYTVAIEQKAWKRQTELRR